MGPRIREDTREGGFGSCIRRNNGCGGLHGTNWWRASGGTGAHEGRPYGRLRERGVSYDSEIPRLRCASRGMTGWG